MITWDKTYKMKTARLLLCMGIFFLSFTVMAQTGEVKPVRKNRFSVYTGLGPNYYFNNLVLLKDEVNALNYSFAGRFMWEPEYNLSLGFETGYYRLYSMKLSGPKQSQVHNSAIPFQIVISMKFLKSFYGNFAIGRSLLINDITTNAYGNFDATAFSLADFSTTVGYKHKLNDRFSLCVESKFYWASKTNDKNIALLFMAGYSFH